MPGFSSATLENGVVLKRILFGTTLLVSVAISLLSFRMPTVTPASAPLHEFSAERAMAHVQAVCQNPRPIGSEEITKAREYIVAAITSLGLPARVQTTRVPDYFDMVPGETVEISNIFTVLQGTNPTGSIVLAGHYDSVPASPGANDDGTAVAALLETTRSLLVGPPLRNDVIVLFTDAEEPGQFRYGARFFVQEYEFLEDIRLVLNLEALGRTGPSIMFETGEGNRWLIEGLNRAAPNPVAFSFMSDLYRNIAKGGTDFAAFDEVGIGGLNFAYAFERTVYHTALDNVESVDKRSLQHHGNNALGLARYYGTADLRTISDHEGDLVFHSLPGGIVIRYPADRSIPLVTVCGILLLGLVILGVINGRVNLGRMAIGVGVSSLEVLMIAIVLTLAWWGIDQLHLSFGTVVEPTVKAHLFLVAFLVLCLASMIALRMWSSRRIGALNLAFGLVWFWWLLSLLAGIYLPGFNVVLTWPLLFALLPLGWKVLAAPPGGNSWPAFCSLLISTAAILVLGCIPVYLFFQAMGIASPGFSGSPSFPIIGFSMLFWTMILGLLLPHIDLVGVTRCRSVLYALLALAGALVIAASVLPGIPVDSFGLSG